MIALSLPDRANSSSLAVSAAWAMKQEPHQAGLETDRRVRIGRLREREFADVAVAGVVRLPTQRLAPRGRCGVSASLSERMSRRRARASLLILGMRASAHAKK
jgi:hypothetical protein